MDVFVLDKRKKPLMPCSPKRARLLLTRGRARVHKISPFTIRIIDRAAEESAVQPVRLKLDPGSKVTGMALVREGASSSTQTVLGLIEIRHRGGQIRDALTQRRSFRRRRRSKLRYRPDRFSNRRRTEGWLAPSLRHRVETIGSWVSRIGRLAPVTVIDMELVRFDTQLLQHPTIATEGYQQGSLYEYEVREYCLEKWARTCMYCDATNVALEVEHIVPRSKGGSNRLSNLGIACVPCNRKKGNMPLEYFVQDSVRLAKIKAHTRTPLRDASAVNTTRFSLLRRLQSTGLPVITASGGRTKFNRKIMGLPKTHVLDAACVGEVVQIAGWQQPPLTIRCTGRGCYKRTRLTKYGFPRAYLMRRKTAFGFSTGDLVTAIVPRGKNTGNHRGRVAVRASGSFDITTIGGVIQGINHRSCRLLQRADGYGYATSPFNKSTPSLRETSK